MDYGEIYPAPELSDNQSFSMDSLPAPEVEDALTIFTRQWNEKLEQKKGAEMKANDDAKSDADEDLSNWNQQRDIRLQAKKEQNRTAEQVLIETFQANDSSNPWDRATKLIDLNADSTDSGKSDVSRMRKLFIQLKNEPLETTRAQ